MATLSRKADDPMVMSAIVPEAVMVSSRYDAPGPLPKAANQRKPKASARPTGKRPLGMAYSVMVPDGVILPIFLAKSSVNHRLPSDPAAIAWTPLAVVGTANSE